MQVQKWQATSLVYPNSIQQVILMLSEYWWKCSCHVMWWQTFLLLAGSLQCRSIPHCHDSKLTQLAISQSWDKLGCNLGNMKNANYIECSYQRYTVTTSAKAEQRCEIALSVFHYDAISGGKKEFALSIKLRCKRTNGTWIQVLKNMAMFCWQSYLALLF